MKTIQYYKILLYYLTVKFKKILPNILKMTISANFFTTSMPCFFPIP
jgi:hypothetical protein